MTVVNIDALRRAPLAREPFQYTVVPGFVTPEGVADARRDFPAVGSAGLLPLSETRYGAGFAALVQALRGGELEAAFSEKFDLDLAAHPMMITVRGHCRCGDGRIHTDSQSKLITGLLYLNGRWQPEGGRLRLLRGPDDLEDMIAEVPPDGGTLVAFRRSDRSYHGHRSYEGERRYVMFNWMVDARVRRRELIRHRVSARLKRWTGLRAAR